MSTRVVLFVERNLDGTTGGSHRCLLDMVKGLDRSRFSPLVVFHQNNDLLEEFQKHCRVEIIPISKGLNFTRLPIPLNWVGIVIQRTFNFALLRIPLFLRIIRFLLRNRVEQVHLNNAPSSNVWLVASLILGIRCSAHLRGFWQPNWLGRLAVRRYEFIVAISNSVASHLESKVGKLSRLYVVYDGIDPQIVSENIPHHSVISRRDFGLDDEAVVLGMIANITRWKGQLLAVQALELLVNDLPNVHLILVGDVSQRSEDQHYYQEIRSTVARQRLSSRVIFSGYRRDVLDILSLVDLVVHPPITPEPLGRVILEAMLCNKLVIASAHGGPAEIIEDGKTGYLVPPADAHALASKIKDVLCETQKLQTIARNGRNMIPLRFDLTHQLRAFEHLLSAA